MIHAVFLVLPPAACCPCLCTSPPASRPVPTFSPTSPPLQDSGAPEQLAKVQTVQRNGRDVDVTVAARPLQAGDVAIRIPERLVVTLDLVFQDNMLAELITTGKLSGGCWLFGARERTTESVPM